MLSNDIIWHNKTYGGFISGKENTKANSNILQYEDRFYNWYHIKIDPVNNESKT